MLRPAQSSNRLPTASGKRRVGPRKTWERIRADETLVFPGPGNQGKVADLARAGFVIPQACGKKSHC